MCPFVLPVTFAVIFLTVYVRLCTIHFNIVLMYEIPRTWYFLFLFHYHVLYWGRCSILFIRAQYSNRLYQKFFIYLTKKYLIFVPQSGIFKSMGAQEVDRSIQNLA